MEDLEVAIVWVAAAEEGLLYGFMMSARARVRPREPAAAELRLVYNVGITRRMQVIVAKSQQHDHCISRRPRASEKPEPPSLGDTLS